MRLHRGCAVPPLFLENRMEQWTHQVLQPLGEPINLWEETHTDSFSFYLFHFLEPQLRNFCLGNGM